MYSLDNGDPHPSDIFSTWQDIKNDAVPNSDKSTEKSAHEPIKCGPPAVSKPIKILKRKRPMSDHCVNLGLIIVSFLVLYKIVQSNSNKIK